MILEKIRNITKNYYNRLETTRKDQKEKIRNDARRNQKQLEKRLGKTGTNQSSPETNNQNSNKQINIEKTTQDQ